MAQPDNTAFKPEIALEFINNYNSYSDDSLHEQKDLDKWLMNNPILTDRFKSIYKKTIDDAYKAEPEVGLDFDPIINGQYSPPKGLKILKFDSTKGYVQLCGKEEKDFTIMVKLVFQKHIWMIDGAGIINIPKSMQRKPK